MCEDFPMFSVWVIVSYIPLSREVSLREVLWCSTQLLNADLTRKLSRGAACNGSLVEQKELGTSVFNENSDNMTKWSPWKAFKSQDTKLTFNVHNQRRQLSPSIKQLNFNIMACSLPICLHFYNPPLHKAPGLLPYNLLDSTALAACSIDHSDCSRQATLAVVNTGRLKNGRFLVGLMNANVGD